MQSGDLLGQALTASWCRLSDFRVFEVGQDGLVALPSAHLLDPALEASSCKTEGAESGGKQKAEVPPLETLLSVIPDAESAKRILALLDSSPSEFLLPSPSSKEERTRIHQSLRELFQGRIQSETSRDGNHIRIYPRPSSGGGGRDGRDERNTRPADHQRYLKFVLYKENMDTIEAMQTISRRLHMGAKDFTYAGTKDRRGHTAQWIVAKNVTPAKILGINKLFADGRLAVCSLQPAQNCLSLGDLRGNRFELAIRDVTNITEEQLARTVKAFAQDGFINYFGLQRFGSNSAVPSHLVGGALLAGDWERAIGLILDPREGEKDQRAVAARRHWKETGDAKAAQALFPTRYTAERQVLAHFSRAEGGARDLLGAVLAINRELRMMYVHSVQSWIWNQLASRRHAQYGRRLVVGDLVMPDPLVQKEVVILSEDTLANYSYQDLVLPLPGYASVYPIVSGVDEQQYRQCLQSLGITLDLQTVWQPKNRALWDLPGAYRKVYVRPEGVQWRIARYADPDQEIGLESSNEAPQSTGEHLGLVIAFTLPSSSYATMAIRELMHGGTDPEMHKQRTKRHRASPSLETD